MAATKRKNTINLNDWYTNDEAVARLSENAGRQIDKNYPRTLARYGKVKSLDIGARGKLYLKTDIDGYVVSTTRGRKKKGETNQHQAQEQEQEAPGIDTTELEDEIERLRKQLAIEQRFRTDTEVRHFQAWLRHQLLPQDTDFYKRFLADTRLPRHASRALYEARLRQYGYSAEDVALFQSAWKDMLAQS